MSDPILYVIVCTCKGEPKDVAFIDDSRPAGGLLSVHSSSHQMIFTPEVNPDGSIESVAPYELVAEKLADRNVTEAFFGDGHLMLTIRCPECGTQVQMSRDTYWSVANSVASAVDGWPLVPSPITGEDHRRMIPLGVLCTMVTHIKGK